MSGVPSSRVAVSPQDSGPAIDFLVNVFPHVGRDAWLARFLADQVMNSLHQPICPSTPVQTLTHIVYFRDIPDEIPIPFEEKLIFENDHIMVVDKPAFLPVIPSGKFVEETLLVRVRRRTENSDIVPLHRLDKDTAGLVIFSKNPKTRNVYHAIFRDQKIQKTYFAVATFESRFLESQTYRSRIIRDPEYFFRSTETHGLPNSATTLQIMAHHSHTALYRLDPMTGKKHQLRVHMAALGIPIVNDSLYPKINDPLPEDYSRPLQLLAAHLDFRDPVTKAMCHFESTQSLIPIVQGS